MEGSATLMQEAVCLIEGWGLYVENTHVSPVPAGVTGWSSALILLISQPETTGDTSAQKSNNSYSGCFAIYILKVCPQTQPGILSMVLWNSECVVSVCRVTKGFHEMTDASRRGSTNPLSVQIGGAWTHGIISDELRLSLTRRVWLHRIWQRRRPLRLISYYVLTM